MSGSVVEKISDHGGQDDILERADLVFAQRAVVVRFQRKEGIFVAACLKTSKMVARVWQKYRRQIVVVVVVGSVVDGGRMFEAKPFRQILKSQKNRFLTNL